MKIAVCLSGQPKFFEKGYSYINKNLLSNFSNIDVFFHCWENIINDQEKEKILNLYKPKKFIFQKEKIHVLNYPFKQSDSRHINANNIFSMFYSLMKSNELKRQYEKENNFKYDWVFRLRYDFALNKNFNNNVLDNLSKKFVYVNNFEESPNPHCADCFGFSSSENMDIYSDTYNNIMKYGLEEVILVGEAMLYKQLIENNLNLIKFDINHPFNPDDINYLRQNPHIKGLLCKNSLIRE